MHAANNSSVSSIYISPVETHYSVNACVPQLCNFCSGLLLYAHTPTHSTVYYRPNKEHLCSKHSAGLISHYIVNDRLCHEYSTTPAAEKHKKTGEEMELQTERRELMWKKEEK